MASFQVIEMDTSHGPTSGAGPSAVQQNGVALTSIDFKHMTPSAPEAFAKLDNNVARQKLEIIDRKLGTFLAIYRLFVGSPY